MHAIAAGGTNLLKIFHSHKSTAAKNAQFVETSPDMVLRSLGKDGEGPFIVMAATVDVLLNMLLDPDYTDDVLYPIDFFLTYRSFCLPEVSLAERREREHGS